MPVTGPVCDPLVLPVTLPVTLPVKLPVIPVVAVIAPAVIEVTVKEPIVAAPVSCNVLPDNAGADILLVAVNALPKILPLNCVALI